jgi:hypothetical protein
MEISLQSSGGSVCPGIVEYDCRRSRTAQPADVTVYVTGFMLPPSYEFRTAQGTTSRMFARIGVRIAWANWKSTSADALATGVVIYARFDEKPMHNVSSEALAYAAPYTDGVKTITIFI